MGDIAYETLSIDAGAQLEGRLARRAALDDGPLIATPVSFSPAKGKSAKTTDGTGGEQPDIFVKS